MVVFSCVRMATKVGGFWWHFSPRFVFNYRLACVWVCMSRENGGGSQGKGKTWGEDWFNHLLLIHHPCFLYTVPGQETNLVHKVLDEIFDIISTSHNISRICRLFAKFVVFAIPITPWHPLPYLRVLYRKVNY